MKHHAKDLEIYHVPSDLLLMPVRRTLPFVRYYATMGQFGELDLKALARDSYMQGVVDGIQVAIKRPQVMDLFDEESSV